MSDAISVLIVDDEPVARSRLRELLADLAPEFPHRIVGEAANAPEALSQIEAVHPQIVLLDVQMPGMTGIELARHISARAAASETPRAMPLVIFVTAFEEFAVEAFEVRAIDYLLKPVRAQRLLEALKRAMLRLPTDQVQAIDQLAKATNTRRRHLSVHERGRVILVPLEQVIYLKAELKYITVRTREREYLIEESLTSLEEEFIDRFVRIHRNALVARPSIAGFERVTPTGEDDSGDPYWQVVLRDIDERLPVSRRQWSTVKNLVT
ncbi:MAG TPA: response regulator transcription factor [Quisquiliibacterium sp.]|nr:response regulator transcription factor [Quisquiliibacterium sp.]HPA91023.1 response regulator transcription factor [Quisquiliibacterium sp.]HQN11533.1 response regulator transcription factor [Quisquiliibacterium sp.]HQP65614.1 response regulator transcription factor [Quisquiliibacterium sp.]